MNILIVTLTYPPEPAEHIHDLAKYLVKCFHKVTVLTSLPSYPLGKIYDKYRGKIWCEEIEDNVKIVRLPVWPSHSKSILKRFLYYFSSGLSITIYSIFMKKNFDVILVYHPPLTIVLPGLLLKFSKKIPFIYWLQDMWPETIEVQIGKTFITKLIGKIEKQIYDVAEKIVVISKGFKQNLIEKGVEDTKIVVIPNWADSNFYYYVKPSANDYKDYDLNPDDFHIFYAGNLGIMQGLEYVVESAKYFSGCDKIKIVFMGTGIRVNDLKILTERLHLNDKIIFLGRVPQSEVNRCYSLADAFIIHIRDIPLNRITIPHKIYGYMLSEKPVIAAIRGDALGEILYAQAGVECNPEDPISIARAAEIVYNMHEEERSKMGKSGREFLLRERTIDVLGPKFEKIFLELNNN